MAESASAPDWQRRFRFQPSAQRNIHKRPDWQTYPYPFIYGQFDAKLFPTADWRECCMKTLSVLEINEWAQDMILRAIWGPAHAEDSQYLRVYIGTVLCAGQHQAVDCRHHNKQREHDGQVKERENRFARANDSNHALAEMPLGGDDERN